MTGIRFAGVDAEERFLALTGAVKSKHRTQGDAVLDGRYVEVKRTTSGSLSQIRAVKYIPLVIYSVPTDSWYVVPPSDVVRFCAGKKRGQHGENPFESACMQLKKLGGFVVTPGKPLREAVTDAFDEGDRHPALQALMSTVLAESKMLAAQHIKMAHLLDVADGP